jgi:hypothetical protein
MVEAGRGGGEILTLERPLQHRKQKGLLPLLLLVIRNTKEGRRTTVFLKRYIQYIYINIIY